MHSRLLLCALVAAALCACGKGKSSAADAGTDGGTEVCAQRTAPVSSAGAIHRFFSPLPIPLPAGSTFAGSPLAARAGNSTVALFAGDSGVGGATSSTGVFASSFSIADAAVAPALTLLNTRFFVGYQQGSSLVVGASDSAAGVSQLGSGVGRTLTVPLPTGATGASDLTLAASSSAGEVVAAFTATFAGGRTAVYLSRLASAGCQACTLSFAAPTAAGPGTVPEEQPRLATSAGGAVTVTFLRVPPHGPPAEVWIAQGTLGASLTLRAVIVDAQAARTPATPAYFSDGTLALVYAQLQDLALDGGASPAPEVADVVARHLAQSTLSPAVKVNDDDAAADNTHWLPGAAVDIYDRLWVAFYDTRFAAPGTHAWGPGPAEPPRDGACTAVVMLSRSDDKAKTFKPNALVTPDGQSVQFDPVPGSLHRARAPLGPVTVEVTSSDLLVGYTDVLGGTGRAQLAEGGLP